MREASAVHHHHFVPDRVEERGVDLVRRQLVEPAPVDIVECERHRTVGQFGERFDGGDRHARFAREQQQECLMFDVVVERERGPVLGGLTQHHGAVAAVQEVGVTAVTRVHLHERAVAVGAVRDVELGAAPLGAFERQAGHARDRRW